MFKIKFISTLFIFISLFFNFSYAILFHQGFSSFKENGNSVSFYCNRNGCALGLGKLYNVKKIEVKGTLTGDGNVVYGFLLGNKFIYQDSKSISEDIVFYPISSRIYNKIPKDSIITLVFIGNIKGSNVHIITTSTISLKEYIMNFLKIEGITPYIINFKYGGKIFFIPSTKFLTYLIGFLLFFLIVFFNKQKKIDYVLYLLLFGTSILSLKNLYEYIILTCDNVFSFNKSHNVFYLGDYYFFIKDIRQNIDLQNCSYDFISSRSWPYIVWAKSVYLKPCNYDNNNPKYVIVYKSNIPYKYKNCKMIYNKNNNLILKCR